jgi:hypothetical protein
VDAKGNAVNYPAASTGNGNLYDTIDGSGGDDYLIGIINRPMPT